MKVEISSREQNGNFYKELAEWINLNFKQLNGDNQMFNPCYMLGIQQGIKRKKNTQANPERQARVLKRVCCINYSASNTDKLYRIGYSRERRRQMSRLKILPTEAAENAFEIVVKGLTEDDKESLKEVIDKEIRRIKYRRHKTETSNLRYVIDLNS